MDTLKILFEFKEVGTWDWVTLFSIFGTIFSLVIGGIALLISYKVFISDAFVIIKPLTFRVSLNSEQNNESIKLMVILKNNGIPLKNISVVLATEYIDESSQHDNPFNPIFYNFDPCNKSYNFEKHELKAFQIIVNKTELEKLDHVDFSRIGIVIKLMDEVMDEVNYEDYRILKFIELRDNLIGLCLKKSWNKFANYVNKKFTGDEYTLFRSKRIIYKFFRKKKIFSIFDIWQEKIPHEIDILKKLQSQMDSRHNKPIS